MDRIYTTLVFAAVSAALMSPLSFAETAAVTKPTIKLPPIAEPHTPKAAERPRRLAHPEPPEIELASTPASVASANVSFGSSNPFVTQPSAVAQPADTALSAPVTINYAGTSTAFAVTDTGGGSGKGISALINNTANTGSALYGQTNGKGAGLTGYNGGTAGPAGKFGITNSASAQAGVAATTTGSGAAVMGTVTNASSVSPAVYGVSSASSEGRGVQGEGSFIGVTGYGDASGSYGVYGEGGSGAGSYGVFGNGGDSGVGIGASSSSGYAISASSASSYAVYAVSSTGSALYASTNSTDTSVMGVQGNSDAGFGVYGKSKSGYGVAGISPNGIAVFGNANNTGTGVYGTSEGGYGVYGGSALSDAGYFEGTVTITKTLTVGSVQYASDKNLKTGFVAVDGKDLLAHIDAMPITSWDYKSDSAKRHIGPMAQDFHAAFGLNGDDDKHINEVDIAGVSLAAIQELNRQMKLKDAEIAALKIDTALQIAELKTQLAAQAQAFSTRMTALESRQGVTTQAMAARLPMSVRPGAAD